MTAPRLAHALAVLSLMFATAACTGGHSDPVSYRAALKSMAPAMTKLDMTTRDASTSGDPMQLSSALQKTVSSAKALLSVIEKVKAGEPNLARVHAGLVAAAKNHVAVLEDAAASAKATPIPETKGLMNDSTEDLKIAVADWNDALDGM